MAFKLLRILNSKKKTDIRFVAAGSYQVEFFRVEDSEYFSVYRFFNGGESGFEFFLIDLAKSQVIRTSEDEFELIDGTRRYSIRVKDDGVGLSVFITRYLWSWLPLRKFGGKASKAGIVILKSNLSKYE